MTTDVLNEFLNVVREYGDAEREFGKNITDENSDKVVEAYKKVCEFSLKI